MELIYLWVKDYKNIKEQGFNFSGRYRCEYDKEKNELTINENKEYVHIFPDNINVTAIVGKNGAGKSSILAELKTNITVAKIDNRILAKKDFKSEFTCEQVDSLAQEMEFLCTTGDFFNLENYDAIHRQKAFDNDDSIEYGYVTDFLLYKDEKLNITKYQQNILVLIFKNSKIYKSGIFNFNPTKCQLRFNNNVSLDGSDMDIIESIKRSIVKYESIYEQFILFMYSLHYKKNGLIEKFKQSDKTKIEFDEIQSIAEEYAKDTMCILELDSYKNFFNTIQPNKNDIFSIDRLVYEAEKSIEEVQEIYKEYEYEFYWLMELGFLRVDFYEKEISFFNLSQGERTVFIDNLLLFDKIKLTEKNNICLLLDEPELSLHPQWQKRYISELIKLLSNIKNKNFHIVIASHSPFILSDIPKENIVFLENGKQLNVNIDTFGANIHTLLTHGFFMEDGLIGEYAKGKINELIDYLSGKKSPIKDDDEAQKYIRIIGEPIIKKQLQRMLDSKRLSKIDEIDLLKAQMSEIEKKLKKLESSK